MAVSDAKYVHRVAVAVGFAALAVVLTLAAWVTSHTLLLIFGGVLLALLLRALAELLARYTGLRESWCVWIVIAALAAVFGFGGWYLSAELSGQFDALGKSLTAFWQRAREWLLTVPFGDAVLSRMEGGQMAAGSLGNIGAFIAALAGGLSSLVISIFVGLYVAADPTMYRRGLLKLVPIASRSHADDILSDLHDTLRGWLMGTFALMIMIGVVTFVGLWLLGIPLALSLAIIAFLLEFIPYVGPILSAVPAVLVASTVSEHAMLFVVLLYWGIQSLEGYILTPLVFQRSVRIPPMLTISAQVMLGTMFGVPGIMFATPLTACAMVLVKRLYVEDALGDRQ